MSYALFLDDERQPEDVTWLELPPYHWHIVRSYEEFVEMIQRMGIPAIVSFDHDLCPDHYKHACTEIIPYEEYLEPTGWHAARYLLERCLEAELPVPQFFTHTLNITGARNIRDVLEVAREVLVSN